MQSYLYRWLLLYCILYWCLAQVAAEDGYNSIAALNNDNEELSCEERYDVLLERLERLEQIFNITQLNPDLDNISILELLVYNVKNKLFNIIPDTDKQCKFDYVAGHCAPACYCSFQPKLGDYTLSRACRKVSNEQINQESCDSTKVHAPWIVRGIKKISNITNNIKDHIVNHIVENAPVTDQECAWNWRRLKCAPEDMCVLDYQFGDYSLSRACRLQLDDFDDDDISLSYIASATNLHNDITTNIKDQIHDNIVEDISEDISNVEIEETNINTADASAPVKEMNTNELHNEVEQNNSIDNSNNNFNVNVGSESVVSETKPIVLGQNELDKLLPLLSEECKRSVLDVLQNQAQLTGDCEIEIRNKFLEQS